MEEIGEYIRCEKTTQLIRKFLIAGHINPETGERETTNMGTPQGGVLSPLISNIVLNKLDSRMDNIKQKFERGVKRKRNPQYNRLTSKINAQFKEVSTGVSRNTPYRGKKEIDTECRNT